MKIKKGMNKKELSILFGLILLSPIFLILSRLFLPTNYLFSSLYKLIFLFPLFYYIYIEKKSLKNIYQENFSFKTVKNTWKKMCILGLGIALIYITTFFHCFERKIFLIYI